VFFAQTALLAARCHQPDTQIIRRSPKKPKNVLPVRDGVGAAVIDWSKTLRRSIFVLQI